MDIPKRGIHRRLHFEIDDNIKRRFWASVSKGAESQCWNWTRGLRNGYGAMKVAGKVISSHRIAYVMHFGEPQSGQIIRHRCDNRICCNPSHLVAGTPGENVMDAVERGQHRVAKGDVHPASKFSDNFVRSVWLIRRLTGWGYRRIEHELNLKKNSLKNVIERKTYPHLIPEWADNSCSHKPQGGR